MTTRSDAQSPEIRSLDQQIMQAESAGRWPQAAQLVRTRAQRVAPVAEQVRTLEHLVSLYRVKLADERGAMQAAEEILAVDAAHADARSYLVAGYTRLGNAGRAEQLRAGAPAGGGILGAIQGAFGTAAAAVGTAATGFASAVEASNQNPEWMRSSAPAPSVSAARPAAPRPSPQGPPRCPYCGADLAVGAKSCGQCGASL